MDPVTPGDPTRRLPPPSTTPPTTGMNVTRPPEVERAAADPGSAFGRYVKIAQLGRGGGGEVWKAYDPVLSRWVALKLLHGTSDEEIARFVREAQTAAQLSHPNIAAIYEVGLEAGRHYLAMQFIEGTTLREAKAEARDAARFVRDAARGVAHAHSRGIVHRDLKPDNIMVAKGNVYVLDFGLARAVEGGSKVSVTGTVVGTPSYMPPEQARAGKVDARSDVYSLGATLYELLSGRPPFQGPTIFAVLKKVEEEEPARMASVDRDLETIVLKCLEKDAARRYETAGALADDIDRALNGEPIHAHPPSLVYRVRKAVGRRKALVAVVVLAVAAVGLAAALILPAYLRASRTVALWREVSVVLSQAEIAARGADRDRARSLVETGVAKCRTFDDIAAAHYFEGRLHAAVGDREAAIQAMERALLLDPGFREPRLAAGVLRAELYIAALRALKARSVEGGPTLPELEAQDPALMKLRDQVIADLDVTFDSSDYVGEADRIYARGMLAYSRGRFGDAVEAFAAALKRDPSHVGALLATARVDLDQSRYDEASATLDKIIDLHRGLAEAVRLRALLRARAFRSTGTGYDEALRDATRAIALEATADAYGTRATIHYFHGDAAEAVRDFNEAVRLDPKRPDFYANRALAHQSLAESHFRQGRQIEAIASSDAAFQDLDAAVNLNPRSAHSRCSRAIARMKRGDRAGAMADFDEAVRLDPKSSEAHVNRGMLHYEQGAFDRALEDCDRAVALGTSASSLSSRAMVRFAMGDATAALEDAMAALKLDPRNVSALVTLGMGQAMRGHDEDALAAFDAAIAADPQFGAAYVQRARVHERANHLRDALADYERALKINPRDGQALLGRGLLRSRDGDLDGAIEDLDAAIAVNPADYVAFANRGLIRLRQNQKPAAADDFRRALRGAPANYPMRGKLEELLRTAESD